MFLFTLAAQSNIAPESAEWQSDFFWCIVEHFYKKFIPLRSKGLVRKYQMTMISGKNITRAAVCVHHSHYGVAMPEATWQNTPPYSHLTPYKSSFYVFNSRKDFSLTTALSRTYTLILNTKTMKINMYQAPDIEFYKIESEQGFLASLPTGSDFPSPDPDDFEYEEW